MGRENEHTTEEIGSLLFPGKTVDGFKVLRFLGRGGMSEVYLARDVKLGRKVALKVVHPESLGSPEAIERFLFEARTTARFSHPHIVTIYAVGEEKGKPYVALEYLEGQTLRQRMDEDRLALREALRVGLAIAEALREAHQSGILHRDLKPENVMIPRDGRLRVLDFGLAKAVPGSAAALSTTAPPDAPSPPTADTVPAAAIFETRAKGARGTPAYMAPEQWREEPCSEATDLWAFGVLLHELLTGERPYTAGTLVSLACKVTGPEPAPVPRLSERAPAALAPLLARCLDKRPAARPAATEVVEALGAMLEGERAEAPLHDSHNPFRGLLPFTERHARLFYGREAEVSAFVERMREVPVLPVVGPSGAGKSSFVQAGVIPRLRELGAWQVIRLRPGDQPFVTLATRLLRDESTARSSSLAAVEELPARKPTPDRASDASLAAALLETPSRLGLRLQQIAEERRCRVLLFVDQMEELYTLCPDEEVRRRFMLAVCTAADDAAEPVRVIFTLRDDHLGRLAEGAQVREALSRLTLIRSPGPEPLEQILTRPLEAVGYRYEDPDLCREMVASVKDELAPLPLLQFATHLLWERRDEGRRLITRAAYEAVGGVAGALALHADGVLEALSPLQLRQARELLLRLVTVDGTRRILAREAALEGLGEDASLVLDRLTEARLIAVRKGRDDGRSEAELELIHESLIASWARLRRWIDESREEVALLHEMSQAASLWARRGQRDDELWRGDALEDARRAVERLGERAPAEVRRFVEAGLWRARRRTRALRLLTAALIVLLAGVSLFLEHEKRSALVQKESARARWAEAQLEGARAAAVQRSPLEARAKLRGSLETRDSPLARALWRRLAQDAQVWKKPLADSVTEVAFSPDGQSLAAACLDGTIYLLDARTTALRAALKDPHDQVFAIAFSPDGRSLASGTREGWLRLFDLASGALESNRRAHDTTIWAVAFSPDGRRIATAADDATLRTFRTPGLDPEQTLRGHGAGVYDLAFTPDGRRLVSGAFDGTVRVWDAAAGGASRPLGHHGARIYDVAVSPDGRTVASAGMDGTIHLTDLASGDTRAVLRGHLSRVLGLAFSPDGARLASGGADQTIRIWRLDPRGAREEKVLIGHADWVRHVAFSPDGKQLASASPDKSVLCWEVAAGGAQRPPTGHTDRVLAVAFHPDGAALATAGADRMVRFWDAATGQEQSALSGHSDWVRAVSFSPDGKRLASGGSDQGIRLWDLESASEREVLLGHRHRVHGLGFSPDGKRLASASGDNTVRIWDLQAGARPLVLEGHRSSVKDVSFSSDGSLLASASEDGTIRIWDARATGKPPRVLEGHRGGVSGVAWSGDGARLLSGGQDHTVRLWEVASGSSRELGQHRGRVYAVALTADGKRAASAGAAGELRLWELGGANARSRELLGHRSEVNAVRFSTRGDLLASAGSDATVRLWSIPSGEPHWRAPALLSGSPRPWLLTHRGWLGEGKAPAAGARWAAAIAHARTVSSAGPTLCLRAHDGRLAIWDRALDRRLFEEAVPSLGAVVASPSGCFVIAGGGLRFYRRTGSFRDLEPGVGSLSRSSETLVLATTASRVLAFNAEGVAAGSYPGGREVSAALLLGTRLILGHQDGRIEVSLVGGAVRRPSAVFRDAPSSPVLLLRAGPAETLLAGHQNGYLALRGLRDGVRLDEAWLHGPLVHLELAGTTAIAASELGDHLRLDLSALTAPACDLLREVWQRVPVIWEGGQPIVRAPPRDHACAPR